MFETRGYEATTVADIAATAEVGTRTFFNYFASKEELLFPEPDERVQAAVRAIATRRPGERPVEVLLRALRAAGDNPGDHLGDTLASRISVLRARISRTVPAVSGRAAYAQLASQQEIAGQLRTAFPEELDDVGAAALVGAVVGAVSGALTVLFQQPGLEDGDQLHRKIQETTSKVLAPWLADRAERTAPTPAESSAAAAEETGPSARGAEPSDHTARSDDRAVGSANRVAESGDGGIESDEHGSESREDDPDARGSVTEYREYAAESPVTESPVTETPESATPRSLVPVRSEPTGPRHAVRRLSPEPLRRALESARPLPTERFTVYRAEDGTTRLNTPEPDPPHPESPWHAPEATRESADDLPLPEDALV